MNRYERMLEALKKLEPAKIELVDDSESHRGHAGYGEAGESHYSLFMVSPKFTNLSRVDRQRLVNEVLNEEFKNGLHALTMKLVSAEEYKN